MTYTFDEARDKVVEWMTNNRDYTKEDLFELAKQVDVTAEGNVTVLYRAVGP